MELRTLRYAIAVYEERNFTRAAERVKIAQPALSVQVRELEREIGTPLFVRGPRGVEPTDAGRAFVARARATLQSAEGAVADARAAAAGVAGELRIGFTASSLFVPAFRDGVRRYRQQRPDVRLRLHQMLSVDLVAAVVRDDLDLACARRGPGPLSERVVATDVAKERFVALLPSLHPLARARGPISLERLTREDFVFFPGESGHAIYDHVMRLFVARGCAPRAVQEADEAHTILGLVAAGVGVSILPASFGDLAGSRVAVRELTPRASSTLAIVRPRAAESTSLARDFVAAVLATKPGRSPIRKREEAY